MSCFKTVFVVVRLSSLETLLPSKRSLVDCFSVVCFGVRLSVMFHFMFAHHTLSSVLAAEWPPFGK